MMTDDIQGDSKVLSHSTTLLLVEIAKIKRENVVLFLKTSFFRIFTFTSF